MDRNKSLLLKLIDAENENEVDNILQTDEYAKTLSWWPFNGDSNNFSTINNQQIDAVAALAEKPINSRDAILLKECKIAGLDPKGSDAPKTMAAAVEHFFGIKEGDLANADDKLRRKLASNIRIIAEGEKNKPNIIIADFGEGQNPADFKNTLLALTKGNKARILFVQGKYGMGGTGVLPFCGTKKYELILSKRHQKLLEPGQKDEWGFSLVRKTPPSKLDERDRHSWFECLVGKNDEILSFSSDHLEILPGEERMEFGCFIKLYNYDLPNPSFITTDLWRDLNRKLYSPSLPILLQENRTLHFKITKGKNDTKVLAGNKLRIQKDDREFVYEALTITASMKAFGEQKIDVIVFKDFDKDGNDLRKRQEWTTAEESVFLTINGQTHYAMPRWWLKKTNLDFLADYLFVHIDCTHVNRAVTDDIFLGSRDRVRDNTDFKAFQEALLYILENNELLQKLNKEYEERQLARLKPDKTIAKKFVANLISKNRELLSYFKLGADVPITEMGDTTSEIPDVFSGSRIPTFLIPRKKFNGPILVKEIPENFRHAVVLFDTDAQNDYFKREEDSGKLIWKSNNPRAVISTWYLYNGMLPIRINIDSPKSGDEFSFGIEISRPHLEPLKIEFKALVVEPHIKGEPEPREPKRTGFNLPELIVVREKPGPNNETWDDHRWSASSVAKVEPGRVYVNMDSSDLHNFITQCPKKLRTLAETMYKSGIYLNSIILNMELDKLQSTDKEKLFDFAIVSISKTLLPICLSPELRKLTNIE